MVPGILIWIKKLSAYHCVDYLLEKTVNDRLRPEQIDHLKKSLSIRSQKSLLSNRLNLKNTEEFGFLDITLLHFLESGEFWDIL
jgi:hypothetical protein